MKSRKVLLSVIVVLLVLGAGTFFLFRAPAPLPPPLPNPNGYDDFVAATKGLNGWNGDSRASAETLRTAVQQNTKALETVRAGLSKASAVPLTNDLNWLQAHIAQMSQLKSMAQLLVAEGLVHLQDGRTNDAARSFTDGIVFAHAAFRRGFMINTLVTFSCQALAAQRLMQVAPHVSSESIAEILPRLIELDRMREPVAIILQRDREWSRSAYGPWQMIWMRIVMRNDMRAQEAKSETNHARSVAALRLLMAELAIRGFSARHGKPPAALEDLVPSWLPAVPLDPFSQRPLVYRVTTNSFVIYSVGPDGKDDSGKPPTSRGAETGDLLPGAP